MTENVAVSIPIPSVQPRTSSVISSISPISELVSNQSQLPSKTPVSARTPSRKAITMSALSPSTRSSGKNMGGEFHRIFQTKFDEVRQDIFNEEVNNQIKQNYQILKLLMESHEHRFFYISHNNKYLRVNDMEKFELLNIDSAISDVDLNGIFTVYIPPIQIPSNLLLDTPIWKCCICKAPINSKIYFQHKLTDLLKTCFRCIYFNLTNPSYHQLTCQDEIDVDIVRSLESSIYKEKNTIPNQLEKSGSLFLSFSKENTDNKFTNNVIQLLHVKTGKLLSIDIASCGENQIQYLFKLIHVNPELHQNTIPETMFSIGTVYPNGDSIESMSIDLFSFSWGIPISCVDIFTSVSIDDSIQKTKDLLHVDQQTVQSYSLTKRTSSVSTNSNFPNNQFLRRTCTSNSCKKETTISLKKEETINAICLNFLGNRNVVSDIISSNPKSFSFNSPFESYRSKVTNLPTQNTIIESCFTNLIQCQLERLCRRLMSNENASKEILLQIAKLLVDPFNNLPNEIDDKELCTMPKLLIFFVFYLSGLDLVAAKCPPSDERATVVRIFISSLSYAWSLHSLSFDEKLLHKFASPIEIVNVASRTMLHSFPYSLRPLLVLAMDERLSFLFSSNFSRLEIIAQFCYSKVIHDITNTEQILVILKTLYYFSVNSRTPILAFLFYKKFKNSEFDIHITSPSISYLKNPTDFSVNDVAYWKTLILSEICRINPSIQSEIKIDDFIDISKFESNLPHLYPILALIDAIHIDKFIDTYIEIDGTPLLLSRSRYLHYIGNDSHYAVISQNVFNKFSDEEFVVPTGIFGIEISSRPSSMNNNNNTKSISLSIDEYCLKYLLSNLKDNHLLIKSILLNAPFCMDGFFQTGSLCHPPNFDTVETTWSVLCRRFTEILSAVDTSGDEKLNAVNLLNIVLDISQHNRVIQMYQSVIYNMDYETHFKKELAFEGINVHDERIQNNRDNKEPIGNNTDDCVISSRNQIMVDMIQTTSTLILTNVMTSCESQFGIQDSSLALLCRLYIFQSEVHRYFDRVIVINDLDFARVIMKEIVAPLKVCVDVTNGIGISYILNKLSNIQIDSDEKIEIIVHFNLDLLLLKVLNSIDHSNQSQWEVIVSFLLKCISFIYNTYFQSSSTNDISIMCKPHSRMVKYIVNIYNTFKTFYSALNTNDLSKSILHSVNKLIMYSIITFKHLLLNNIVETKSIISDFDNVSRQYIDYILTTLSHQPSLSLLKVFREFVSQIIYDDAILSRFVFEYIISSSSILMNFKTKVLVINRDINQYFEHINYYLELLKLFVNLLEISNDEMSESVPYRAMIKVGKLYFNEDGFYHYFTSESYDDLRRDLIELYYWLYRPIEVNTIIFMTFDDLKYLKEIISNREMMMDEKEVQKDDSTSQQDLVRIYWAPFSLRIEPLVNVFETFIASYDKCKFVDVYSQAEASHHNKWLMLNACELHNIPTTINRILLVIQRVFMTRNNSQRRHTKKWLDQNATKFLRTFLHLFLVLIKNDSDKPYTRNFILKETNFIHTICYIFNEQNTTTPTLTRLIIQILTEIVYGGQNQEILYNLLNNSVYKVCSDILNSDDYYTSNYCPCVVNSTVVNTLLNKVVQSNSNQFSTNRDGLCYVRETLILLKELCEGHYLKWQKNLTKICPILADIVGFQKITNHGILITLFRTITELCQGPCFENQFSFVYHSNFLSASANILIETLNYTDEFIDLIDSLQTEIIISFMSFIEGGDRLDSVQDLTLHMYKIFIDLKLFDYFKQKNHSLFNLFQQSILHKVTSVGKEELSLNRHKEEEEEVDESMILSDKPIIYSLFNIPYLTSKIYYLNSAPKKPVNKHIRHIEIINLAGDLETIYFEISADISDSIVDLKKEFLNKVPRDSDLLKVHSLINVYGPLFIDAINSHNKIDYFTDYYSKNIMIFYRIFSILLNIGFLFTRFPSLIYLITMVISFSKLYFNSLNLLNICQSFICIFIYKYEWLSVFLLIDVVKENTILMESLYTVKRNGKTLVLTGVLWLILLLLYSHIGYYFLFEDFPVSGESSRMDFFLFVLNFGLRSGGGIGDVLTDNTTYFRIIFDLTFFILSTLVLSNVVGGIIIDSFGESRDRRVSINEDQRTRCFICGIESYEFDRFSVNHSGFIFHTKTHHHMWNYIYFIYYVLEKSPTELTGAEDYVKAQYLTRKIDWIPLGRSSLPNGTELNKDN